jgi:hypothetical protein
VGLFARIGGEKWNAGVDNGTIVFGFPSTRLGVCYCLGSGPVSHQGALRARGAENLPQTSRDAANSESLCRRAYERESLRGLGFQITPDCLHTAEVGGSIPPAPTPGSLVTIGFPSSAPFLDLSFGAVASTSRPHQIGPRAG